MNEVVTSTVPTMEKPYDLKNLALRLKEAGLIEAEDAAEAVLLNLLAWVKDSATLSPNAIDDMLCAGLPYIQKAAMPWIDKIDGKQG